MTTNCLRKTISTSGFYAVGRETMRLRIRNNHPSWKATLGTVAALVVASIAAQAAEVQDASGMIEEIIVTTKRGDVENVQ